MHLHGFPIQYGFPDSLDRLSPYHWSCICGAWFREDQVEYRPVHEYPWGYDGQDPPDGGEPICPACGQEDVYEGGWTLKATGRHRVQIRKPERRAAA